MHPPTRVLGLRVVLFTMIESAVGLAAVNFTCSSPWLYYFAIWALLVRHLVHIHVVAGSCVESVALVPVR